MTPGSQPVWLHSDPATAETPPPARSQAMSSIDLTAGQMLEASAGKSEAGSGASNAAPAPPAHASPRV